MWTRFTFLLVALAAASAEFGWKSGHQYTYEVTSTTVTGLETSPQYTGLVVKAQLTIHGNSEQELIATIDHAEKAPVHTHLKKGYELEIPREVLQFQPFTLSKQSFIIRLKEGTIDELVISKEVPIWEVNIIKSIVSQLQLDTQGKKLIRSKLNMIPQDENESTAVYKIMENTVEGECEVLYDITPLPKYILQSQPSLAPLVQMTKDENMINIMKTKNFTNCLQRPGYHFGLNGITRWKPTVNKMGSFLSRSSVGRVIISGNLKQYTIHSSETTNQVVLSPELYNEEKGVVYSRVNLTLVSLKQSEQKVEQPTQPQVIRKLVYEYNSPTKNDQEARQRWDQRNDLPHGGSRMNQYMREKKERYVRSIMGDSDKKYQGKYGDDYDSDESFTVSTEQWHQEIPKLTMAPETPFLPYSIGCSGHSIQQCKNVNVNQVVKKLTEQIGQQLQEPHHVPQTSTLERFAILTRIIRQMTAEQLQKLTEELWVKKETENDANIDPRRSSWMAYRDAVAQAGTGPALVTIKQWIQNDKIQGEEAAQVVATMGKSTMQPTTEYIKTFFEIVKDQKVIGHHTLRDAAICSFTGLVRMAQVDRKTALTRYPVHAFGRFTPSDYSNIVEEYIPYLAEKLQQAVQEQDSLKIQAYIRGLGNLAHPKILSVFEPYLEGQERMTDFQRTLIIVSLKELAQIHPRIARSVLYKTYSNIGEVHQVRVAAVYNLMRTVPPANMLQRMAQYTHEDPSYQVRAAVKSAIESAALLKNKENEELYRNAQSAVNMLTPEIFGIQYSRSNLTDFILDGLKISYTDNLEYIGSDDSIIPSYLYYGLRSNFGGFKRQPLKFNAMVSSVQDLMNLFETTVSVNEGVQGSTGKDQEWNYEKVSQTLNMEHDLMRKFEGGIIYKLAGSDRLYTFDNRTIEYMLEKLIQLPFVLTSGKGITYQKLYNSYTVQIGFPTGTGLPFVYTLETPTLLFGRGKVQLKGEKSSSHSKNPLSEMSKLGGMLTFEGAYSTRTQSQVGFVTPFDHQHYVAGVQYDKQINLPVKLEADVDLTENRMKLDVQPIQKGGDLRIIHYSSKQYTSQNEITEFKPITEVSNTKVVHLRQPQKYEHTFSRDSGFGIRVQVESERQTLGLHTLYELFKRHSMVSPLVFPTVDSRMENTKVEVFCGKECAKSLVFNIGLYETENNRDTRGNQKNQKMPNKVQEIINKVQAGIKSPETVVVDMGLEVKGEKNIVYSGVFGYGFSPVDEEKKLYIRYHKSGGDKPEELCFEGVSKMPFVPETDFTKAIQNQPKGQVSAELRYGEKCESGAHVTLAGKFERTPERTEYLKKLPQVHNCQNEMKDGNKMLSGCKNATFNANLLDRYILTIKYDNVPTEVKNKTHQLYTLLRHLGYPYLSEKLTDHENTEGHKIELDTQFSPDLKSVNVYITSPEGVAHFRNVRVNKYLRSVLVMHPTWDVLRRVGWSALRQKYNAYCTIDENKIKTFDNVTYPVQMTNHWYPVFISTPKTDMSGQFSGIHKFVVLTREGQQKGKEMQVTGTGNTNDFSFSIHVKPSSGNVAGDVTINGQQIQINSQQVHKTHDKHGNVIIKTYALPTGELKLIFPECDMEILYNTQRIEVTADQTYMKRTLGLCGDYDGEHYDFITPKGKYLHDPEEFVATWVLSNEGKYGQLKERAEKNSVRKHVILTGVVSDQDAGRTDIRGRQYTKEQERRGYYDSSSSSSSESNENDNACMTKRMMAIERDGKHCFSTRPELACKPGCQVEKTKPMTAKFVCVNKTQTTSHWAQMVTRGAMPNLSDKVNNVQELTFQAPIECSRQ